MRCALLMAALACTPALAQGRDSAGDALAGHRAEQRQWQGESDALRRPLFYDPVDLESPVVGLPCDHRPQGIAGRGFVVLLESREASPRRLRFFVAPGEAADMSESRKMAAEFAKSRFGAVEFREIAARSFGWCR